MRSISSPRSTKPSVFLDFDTRCRCQVADTLVLVRWSHAAETSSTICFTSHNSDPVSRVCQEPQCVDDVGRFVSDAGRGCAWLLGERMATELKRHLERMAGGARMIAATAMRSSFAGGAPAGSEPASTRAHSRHSRGRAVRHWFARLVVTIIVIMVRTGDRCKLLRVFTGLDVAYHVQRRSMFLAA